MSEIKFTSDLFSVTLQSAQRMQYTSSSGPWCGIIAYLLFKKPKVEKDHSKVLHTFGFVIDFA